MDGLHAGGPTTERGEIERLARECRAADCQTGLDSTVFETRFNVVRSPVPDIVTTVRVLGDYLPPVDRRGPMTQAEGSFGLSGRFLQVSAPVPLPLGRPSSSADPSLTTRAGVTSLVHQRWIVAPSNCGIAGSVWSHAEIGRS